MDNSKSKPRSKEGSRKTMAENHVSREEFNDVRDAVFTMEKTVSGLFEATKSQHESIDRLENAVMTLVQNQAESRGKAGTVNLHTVWHAFGAACTVGVIASALVMYAIGADLHPIRAEISEAHKMRQWVADVVNLQADWQYRTRNTEDLPPPSYIPLQNMENQ